MVVTTAAASPSLSLPRILCLHGGGTNSEVFRLQFRALAPVLAPYFRFIFVDAPFISAPHPDIALVFGDFGPFRQWLRWRADDGEINGDEYTAEEGMSELQRVLREAMEADNKDGGTGEWVGLLGFSQGAKVAASILCEQQMREEAGSGSDVGACGISGVHWRFAVLLAGRGPFIHLTPSQKKAQGVVSITDISDYVLARERVVDPEAILRLPTLHVHGLRDPGLEFHQVLLEKYCAPDSATLVEWDEGHRLPIKQLDVRLISDAILDLAQTAGVDLHSS